MAQETSNDAGHSPSAKPPQKAALVVLIATLIGSGAAVLAIPGAMDTVKKVVGLEQSPPGCAAGGTSSVAVETEPTVGSKLNYSIRIKCPAPDGNHYTTIFELPAEGSPPHPVYYCKETYKDVKPDTVQSHTEPIKGKIGSVRHVYVVLVPDSESDRCTPDGSDFEGVTHPPSTTRVSNAVVVTRTW